MPPKGHSILSASSSDRWLHCPPSARLCETYEDKGSDYAAEGTDAHALCEYKLLKALGMEATDPTKSLDWYNAEMEDCATGYASFIMELLEDAKQTCSDPVVLIEQRVDFSRWVEQGFGKMTNPMKVITGPNTRWSYANVWEPKSINGGTPKYSVSLIIPKSDTKTVAKIEAAIEAAYREGEAKLKGNGKSVPALSVLKTPLRDGDLERPDDPAYAGSFFVNANATSAPGIVDADRNPILTRSEVYSGIYGRASISFYAFNSSGNKGIACGLNNLQKIHDGEPLGGKASAESDFATDNDDDFLD